MVVIRHNAPPSIVEDHARWQCSETPTGCLRHRVLALLMTISIALGVLALSSLPAPTTFAQETRLPPELGAVVVDDSLLTEGAFRAGGCPTGRNTGDFVPEGFRTRVSGPCLDTSTFAAMAVTADWLTIGDGEVAADAKLAESAEWSWLGVGIRERESGDSYALTWAPSLRYLQLWSSVGPTTTVLAEGAALMPPSGGSWTRLALRMDRDMLWGLVDDQPVLGARSPVRPRGEVMLAVGRLGEVSPDTVVAVHWRNLHVSALANGEPARAPSYQTPAPS